MCFIGPHDWTASCGGFWKSIICWQCSDPLPVFGFLMLARNLFLLCCLFWGVSFWSFSSEEEKGDRGTQNDRGHKERVCRKRKEGNRWELSERWVPGMRRREEVVGGRWARDSGKGRESKNECKCVQCVMPAYVPFSWATGSPPITQLLGSSRGPGTQELLFFLARPTAL